MVKYSYNNCPQIVKGLKLILIIVVSESLLYYRPVCNGIGYDAFKICRRYDYFN